MSNLFTETELDKLNDLRKKRLNEIATNGSIFTNQNTDKSYRGIFDAKTNEAIFPPESVINPGSTLESKHGTYYVAAIASKIGLKMAKLLPISGSIEVMSTKSGGFVHAGTQPVLGSTGSEISVPAFGSPSINSAIKRHGQLLRVVSIRRDGPLNALKTEPITAPVMQKTKCADNKNFVNASHMTTQKAYGMNSY